MRMPQMPHPLPCTQKLREIQEHQRGKQLLMQWPQMPMWIS